MSTQESSIGTGSTAPPPDASSATISEAAPVESTTVEPTIVETTDAPAQGVIAKTEGAEGSTVEPDVESQPEEEFDLFQTQDKPRTLEDIKKQYPRNVAGAVLDDLVKTEAARFEAEAKLSALGGTEGLGVASDLMKHVVNPNPNWDDVDSFMVGLETINPALQGAAVARMGSQLIEDENFRRPIMDQGLTKEYGEGFDTSFISKLVSAYKRGLINEEDLKDDYAPSPREQQLQAQLAKVDGHLKQVEAQQQRAQAEARQQAVERSDRYLTDEVQKLIAPRAKQFGRIVEEGDENTEAGQAKIQLCEQETVWLNHKMKDMPEYENLRKIMDNGQAFNQDGSPSKLFIINAKSVINKGYSLYTEAARKTQPYFASRQPRPRTKTPGSPTTTAIPPAAQPPKGKELSLDEEVAQHKQVYRAKLADIESQAALATQ